MGEQVHTYCPGCQLPFPRQEHVDACLKVPVRIPVYAWEEAVGKDDQEIATLSRDEANRMVAGGHLRWIHTYDQLVIAGGPQSEIRMEALSLLGVLTGP